MSVRTPTAEFWITVALAAVLAYPLSFGPACWISSRLNTGTRAVTVIYRPVTWCCLRDDYAGPLDSAVRWYAGLGVANENWGWWGNDLCNEQKEQWVWRPLGPPP
ncbi:MAG: hypothetical protein ACM3U2_01630 [Deltaproteobacteria bacterium]